MQCPRCDKGLLPLADSFASYQSDCAPSKKTAGKHRPVEEILRLTCTFSMLAVAKHRLTGHHVAMKFISKRKISSKEMSDRVQREIQYLTLLNHPHIIKLCVSFPTVSGVSRQS